MHDEPLRDPNPLYRFPPLSHPHQALITIVEIGIALASLMAGFYLIHQALNLMALT